MKSILLVSVAPTLRSYIAKKLQNMGIGVSYADNCEVAFDYLQRNKFSLIILEWNMSRKTLFDFFEQKRVNSELTDLPTIFLANSVNKTESALLSSYNVKKILAKPIKVDVLFSYIGNILGFTFEMDKTPSILEIRVNEGVLFVELAQGLNNDKLELLKFRLVELIRLYKLINPKVLIMMTDLDLNQSDANKLEFLIDNILAIKIIKQENIKFLTMNSFVVNFFKQRVNYKEIEVVSSLSDALATLISDVNEANVTMPENILQLEDLDENNFGDLEMRFKTDTPRNCSIAIVDDDPVVTKIMTSIFDDKAKVACFSDGESFLAGSDDDAYDIVFLDMIMPGLSGLAVLKAVNKRRGRTPFVILSSVTQREVIIKALEKGAKRYVLKPVNKDIILKKTEEVLGAVF